MKILVIGGTRYFGIHIQIPITYGLGIQVWTGAGLLMRLLLLEESSEKNIG